MVLAAEREGGEGTERNENRGDVTQPRLPGNGLQDPRPRVPGSLRAAVDTTHLADHACHREGDEGAEDLASNPGDEHRV